MSQLNQFYIFAAYYLERSWNANSRRYDKLNKHLSTNIIPKYNGEVTLNGVRRKLWGAPLAGVIFECGSTHTHTHTHTSACTHAHPHTHTHTVPNTAHETKNVHKIFTFLLKTN
jgi:ABC-type nickel/cobalt efflux system permease component RcnA